MTPAQLAGARIFAAQVNAGLARAYKAAEAVSVEFPDVQIQVFLDPQDQEMEWADPLCLPDLRYLVNGRDHTSELLPLYMTSHEMAEWFRSAAREQDEA